MAESDPPQVMLTTPPRFELQGFLPLLAGVLDAHPIACLRLSLAQAEEGAVARAADALRAEAHARDVPLILDDGEAMAARLGLDGVHVTAGAGAVPRAREALGKEAIVGAYCGASRHAGMTAAEAGADYVALGPLSGPEGAHVAEPALFQWWAEMIEVPVVALGGLTEPALRAVAGQADFFCFGAEVWDAPEGPVARLADLRRLLAEG